MDDIDPNKLRPTEDDDVLFSIAHGLRFDGKRRLHYADDHMARIAAAHLLKHLKTSGYVVMKKPPSSAPNAPDYGIPMKD
jgi:hypothetical protein